MNTKDKWLYATATNPAFVEEIILEPRLDGYVRKWDSKRLCDMGDSGLMVRLWSKEELTNPRNDAWTPYTFKEIPYEEAFAIML